MDLTGHYLNSILERRTVELQEKTAELESLLVAQYEKIQPSMGKGEDGLGSANFRLSPPEDSLD